MSEVETRREENKERLQKWGTGLTPKEFEDKEKLLEAGKSLKWATPKSAPVIPAPMRQPMKRQKLMVEVLREGDEA